MCGQTVRRILEMNLNFDISVLKLVAYWPQYTRCSCKYLSATVETAESWAANTTKSLTYVERSVSFRTTSHGVISKL